MNRRKRNQFIFCCFCCYFILFFIFIFFRNVGLWYINHVSASGHKGHMGSKHLIQYFIYFFKDYEVGKQKVWEEETYSGESKGKQ